MGVMTIKRHLAAFALLLLSACAPAPERVIERRLTAQRAPRGEEILQRSVIVIHNRERAAVGTAPASWDDDLAASALAYAETMARTGRFEHAVQPMNASRQGENLFTGSRDAYGYAEMLGYWVAEKKDFIDGPTPQFSRTGRWQDVGHYTQMVWRSSIRVGCALASNATDDYLVCRYAAPGNVVGQKAF